jgi:hypothetical protein
MKKSISDSILREISKLGHASSRQAVARLETRVERALRHKPIESLDADSAYWLGHFYRVASIVMDSAKYRPLCIRCFELAMNKASLVSRDRVVADRFAYLSAVSNGKNTQEMRRALTECLYADIAIAADAAVSIAMIYEDSDNYKKSIGILKKVIAIYESKLTLCRSSIKFYEDIRNL